MHTLGTYEPIREELAQVDANLGTLASGGASFLSDLLSHVYDTPGKRVRPIVTLLAGQFYPHDPKPTVTMATAVELLHIATLIHDDTVDHAHLRRGKATVNNLWGRDVAVLLGDYVFASSATHVCDTGNIRVVRRFSETIMALSRGELRESMSAFDPSLTLEHYWLRIQDKTASLFVTAAESGAILSEAPEEHVQALAQYGLNLGMAFQVVDDILDLSGDEKEVGKPIGNDLREGTLTLPSLMLIERNPEDNPIKRYFQDRGQDRHLREAVSAIQGSDILDQAYVMAIGFVEKAKKALEVLPSHPAQRCLEDLSTYVIQRNR